MKKKNIIIISVAGVIVIAVILFFALRKSSKGGYELQTTTMNVSDINTVVTATGTVEPVIKVDVGTQVSGIIDKIYVDYNSEVKKGQILAELDKTTLESDLASKQMELQAAKVEYEYQQKNYARMKELYDKELISSTDFETAQYSYEKAESTYKKLTSDLVKVRTNLGYATITSPIDGVVLSKAVEEGQTVAASFNTPTLFTIANDLTKMQVIADVDEADIGQVFEGQNVTFTVDAYPNDVFEGSVLQVRLQPTTTSNVVTYEVLIDAPNPDSKLKPGLTANITIYTLELDGINTLPNKALSFKPNDEVLAGIGYDVVRSENENNNKNKTATNGKTVWLLNGHSVQSADIVLGETDGINTQIISGLSPKDLVVMGITEASKNKEKKTNGESSPFMPQRPGGNGNKK